MAEVTFETTVQKTVIEVEDKTGTPVNVEPAPEVSFSVENGNAGGGGVDMEISKKLYSARFEQNSDCDNTWTMVMPVVSGVIMNEDDTVTIQM